MVIAAVASEAGALILKGGFLQRLFTLITTRLAPFARNILGTGTGFVVTAVVFRELQDLINEVAPTKQLSVRSATTLYISGDLDADKYFRLLEESGVKPGLREAIIASATAKRVKKTDVANSAEIRRLFSRAEAVEDDIVRLAVDDFDSDLRDIEKNLERARSEAFDIAHDEALEQLKVSQESVERRLRLNESDFNKLAAAKPTAPKRPKGVTVRLEAATENYITGFIDTTTFIAELDKTSLSELDKKAWFEEADRKRQEFLLKAVTPEVVDN